MIEGAAERLLAVGIIILLSIVGVWADIHIKYASMKSQPFHDYNLYGAILIYGLTAFGWVVALQHLKLATIGVIYSVSMVVLLTLAGWFFFGETLGAVEWIAVAMGACCILLLWRFA